MLVMDVNRPMPWELLAYHEALLKSVADPYNVELREALEEERGILLENSNSEKRFNKNETWRKRSLDLTKRNIDII